jgi:large subunit ribosomal protein L28
MARKCDICGKSPIVGNKISHAHNLTKRRWLPNLQRVRVTIKGRPQRIYACTQCIRSGALEKLD